MSDSNYNKLELVDSVLPNNDNVVKSLDFNKEIERIKKSLSQSQLTRNHGSWKWDIVSHKINWSENLFNILGYDPKKVTPSLKALFKIIHPDDLRRVLDTIQQQTSDNQLAEVEFRIILADGSQRTLYCYSTFELDSISNKKTYLSGIVQDITERKRAEDELSGVKADLEERVSQRSAKLIIANRKLKKEIYERKQIETELKYYEKIVSSTREFLSVLDNSYTYLSANKYYLDSFQLTKDEVVGHTVEELHGKERFEKVIKPNLDKALSGETIYINHWIELPTGKRYVDGVYSPIIGEGNQVLGIVVSAHDITDEKRSFDALKYSNELNSTILNTALDGIITINEQGEIKEFNPSAEKIFDYLFEQVNGKSIHELIVFPNLGEDYHNSFSEYLKKNKKRIIGKQIQVTAMRSSGEEFPMELTLAEINLDNERLFTAFMQDISEREKVENELIESEQRYRTMIDTASNCISTIAADGALINMNPAGLAMFGAERLEQVRGVCVYDLVVEEYRDEFIALNEHVFKGETCDLLFQIKGLQGRKRWMETHAVPLTSFNNDDEVIGHLAITVDVSSRIERQKALKESEERFRSSFEHGPLGMGIGDRHGNILQVNKAFCDFSGYTEEELLNKNFREFIAPDDIEFNVQNFTRLFSGEIEHYRQISRYKHKQGHYVWADINVSVINDANGKPKYLIKHLQDITERIQSEYLQEAQRKILEQIVNGTSQKEILSNLCLMFESLAPTGAVASILLLNSSDGKLYVGAAPSLARCVAKAFEGFMTGEQQASCGTAAFRGEKVIVDDVSTSPLWSNYRDFALENGILACWSIPFFSEQGNVLGTFAISLTRPATPTKYDIERLEMAGYLASIVVQRVRSVTELRESEARFRGAFGNAPMGTALVDRNGVILQANSRSTEVIGFTPEEIIGKSIAEVSHPDDIEESIKKFNELMSGQIESYQLEKRYKHKEGGYVWCRLSLSLVKDQVEQPLYAIAHIEDISDRKKSELALRRYNRALEMVNKCNATLFHTVEQHDLLQQLCNIIVEIGGYRFAWVGYAEDDEEQTVIPKAKSGYEEGYLNNRVSWKRNKNNYCHTAEAILTSEPKVIKNIKNEPRKIGWRDDALQRGYNSCISLPLISENKAFGALIIYSAEYDVFDDDELQLLMNLADNLAFGIESNMNRKVREEAEKSLRISESKFRALFDENPCMFFIVDDNATIKSVNKFGATELGYSVEEITGHSLFGFIDNEDKFTVNSHLRQCLINRKEVHRWEMRTSRKDGEKLWVRVLARVAAGDSQENNILIVCEDITEARILSDKLVHEATHDGLTGLINRHEFEKRLQRALASAQTESSQYILCYLDLDRFKIINDSSGHLAGDKLLKQLSKLLQGKIRNRDSLARLGGDEFGLLIEHCSLHKAEQIANNLRKAIADFQFYWNDNIFKIGVSIGMVEINNNSSSVSDALMIADNACYTAKDKGRDRIHIHKEGDTELEVRRKEMLWTTRIQKAFEEDRFSLAYQTIIPLDLNENKGEHGEILIRMKDEEGDIVTPDVFIPIAERYNLITSIDKHVISMTFSWLKENADFLKRLHLCSINLSGSSMVDDDVLKFIINKLAEYKIPAGKVCFEITETAAIANLNSANYFISELKKQGCLFALDDFGSGLSSFAYLKALPVDFLKIDGAFVKDIENEQGDLAIVKSIHEIGRALNKMTIAEFVENESIKQILKGIGVNYAQGYGIERPKPLIEVNCIKKSNTN